MWYNWLIPAWVVLLGAGAATGLMMGFYFLLKLILPKTAAIARVAAKETWSQPLFWVELMLGAVLLLLFVFIPYNTFGDDIKVLKDSGLTLILVLSIILAVWSASVSIADELEGRTALTLLSKPVSRRQFIIGKFFGVLAPVFTLYIVLGSIFLIMVSYKVVYDARELTRPDPTWQQCFGETALIVPGLVLAFLETMTMTAVSVAISTRLPMLPNLLICSSIYVVGHLVPNLVQSSAGKIPLVGFMGKLLAAILPVLDYFNIEPAIAAGRAVPLVYVGVAFAYAVLYSTVALLVALLLFENRDLA